MSQPDTVKVELELPEPVHRAIKVICETFNEDPHKFMVESIKQGLDGELQHNFEPYAIAFTDRIKKILES